MGQRSTAQGPQFVSYFGPLIEALRKLGGSATPSEVRERIVTDLGVSEEAQEETTSSGAPRLDNRIYWARFYLARAGLIDSSRRGVWTLTEAGRSLKGPDHKEAIRIFKEVAEQFRLARRQREAGEVEVGDLETAPQDASIATAADHRHQVIETLLQLPPGGFERFCQRLLRESGFQQVEVTGRSGDGGIDGHGVLQVNALVSFKVLFQCKRYSGSVTPTQVRDFRGAMMGRADKGIILTTGSFTSEAKREALRDGVPPIELVDGEKLVGMLERLELGLAPVTSYRLDDRFFDEFRS